MIQGEPLLDELLDEPIIGLLAQSDGVSLDELRALFERVREWLAGGSASTGVLVGSRQK
jgi:hypothetical protein